MDNSFLQTVVNRRTIYHLGNSLPISKEDVLQKIKQVVQNAPSAFNSQSSRIVVLLGESHQKLWQLTKDILQQTVPEENFQATADKIQSFASAYGTILFFEEQKTVEQLQNKYSLYRDSFPIWAEQSNAMLQYAIWTMFWENDIGVSLQHYNPLIDDAVKKQWSLSESWQLIGQMPFGNILQPADEKTYLPIDELVKVFD